MADGHGGARVPLNPAPVSGPGALSRRTDGVQAPAYIAGGDYGDGGLVDVQAGADLAAAAPVVAPEAVPMGAPSAQPDVPVTDGAELGPGVSGMELPQDGEEQWAGQMVRYLPSLIAVANGPEGSPNLRRYVRELRLAVARGAVG